MSVFFSITRLTDILYPTVLELIISIFYLMKEYHPVYLVDQRADEFRLKDVT